MFKLRYSLGFHLFWIHIIGMIVRIEFSGTVCRDNKNFSLYPHTLVKTENTIRLICFGYLQK